MEYVLPRRLARILPPIYSPSCLGLAKAIKDGTGNPLITLSRIVKVSRLLHSVELGTLSQFPSPGFLFQGPYGSEAWWAVTPPTTYSAAGSSSSATSCKKKKLLGKKTFQYSFPMGHYPQFPGINPSRG